MPTLFSGDIAAARITSPKILRDVLACRGRGWLPYYRVGCQAGAKNLAASDWPHLDANAHVLGRDDREFSGESSIE